MESYDYVSLIALVKEYVNYLLVKIESEQINEQRCRQSILQKQTYRQNILQNQRLVIYFKHILSFHNHPAKRKRFRVSEYAGKQHFSAIFYFISPVFISIFNSWRVLQTETLHFYSVHLIKPRFQFNSSGISNLVSYFLFNIELCGINRYF